MNLKHLWELASKQNMHHNFLSKELIHNNRHLTGYWGGHMTTRAWDRGYKENAY